ncbi:HsdM family class I SAM-dependent methyltransferase, partial [Mailhella sp.]
DNINKIDQKRFQDKDLIGRVYEYYLQAFSIKAEKEEGEFYTPHSIVELIASLIEPFDGTIYDPCCGSGGMFVQSAKLVEARGGNTRTINVYGQESEPATFRLAKMNLAVRGISYHLGDKAASTFSNDQHPDLKVSYVMANPPFNLKKWRGTDELTNDYRWKGYGLPPESNANYAWILHILSKLDVNRGIAGFLLANGALEDSDTLSIRTELLKQDKVEAIIVLPREMFYSTDISVTLWILNNNKKGGIRNGRTLRDRSNEVLFIDLRTWNTNIYEKKFVQLGKDQIEAVQRIYFDWQTKPEAAEGYAEPELYYAAKLEEIASKDYSLVPSRYIEFVDRDTEIDYKTALASAGAKVRELAERQQENQKNLLEAFKVLGYECN